jgi:beta-N-acetylhexosaminidase
MMFRPFFWFLFLFQVILFPEGKAIGYVKSANSSIPSGPSKLILEKEINKLSFDEKISILIAVGDTHNLKSNFKNINTADLDLSIYGNLDSIKYTDFAHVPLHFWTNSEDEKLTISNKTIGLTKTPKYANIQTAISIEKIIKTGANVVASKIFKLKNSDEDLVYHSNLIESEKYWSEAKQGALKNGVLLSGIGFFEEEMNAMSISDYESFVASGIRYLSSNDDGAIHLENNWIAKLDSIPVPFSDRIINQYIRKTNDFNGLIVSPNLSETPLIDQSSLALKSLVAGVDVVIVSGKALLDVKKLTSQYFHKNKNELNQHIERILKVKWLIYENRHSKTNWSNYEDPFHLQMIEKSIICLQNNGNLLPIKNLNQKFSIYSDKSIVTWSKTVQQYVDFKMINGSGLKKDQIAETLLFDGFSGDFFGLIDAAKNVTFSKRKILFTDLEHLMYNRTMDLSVFDAIILSANDSELAQSIGIQAIFGAIDVTGRTNTFVTPSFKMNSGIELKSLNRFKYVDPRYVGLNEKQLLEIDRIVKEGIKEGAFPGCQVQIAWKGTVFYQKSFGYLNQEKTRKVENESIYDLASITKIAGSTIGLMKLQGDENFVLNKTLNDYIPEVTNGSNFQNVLIKDMMAHQAGFPAWIPFYVKTMTKGEWDNEIYSQKKEGEFNTPVADKLWIKDSYADVIYKRIVSQNLSEKKYLYSDLGYYFVKKIIEKQSKETMNEFLDKEIYSPLGLRTMGYSPYNRFELDRIAPTENDKTFRKQVVHGYVHDPGAAMLGGVGGHAGLFSNANDLCVLMQLCLNKGEYGGLKLLNGEIIDEFTSVQFPNNNNRRGAGFDKPTLNKIGGTACPEVSSESYGHSGFTGTLAWADPTYEINYVFLSNRIHPSAENWKIVKMDIRTNIQTVIYKTVKSAKNYNFSEL